MYGSQVICMAPASPAGSNHCRLIPSEYDLMGSRHYPIMSKAEVKDKLF